MQYALSNLQRGKDSNSIRNQQIIFFANFQLLIANRK